MLRNNILTEVLNPKGLETWQRLLRQPEIYELILGPVPANSRLAYMSSSRENQFELNSPSFLLTLTPIMP